MKPGEMPHEVKTENNNPCCAPLLTSGIKPNNYKKIITKLQRNLQTMQENEPTDLIKCYSTGRGQCKGQVTHLCVCHPPALRL